MTSPDVQALATERLDLIEDKRTFLLLAKEGEGRLCSQADSFEIKSAKMGKKNYEIIYINPRCDMPGIVVMCLRLFFIFGHLCYTIIL